MKNTFAVTMTLLLAFTLGGSYAGYRIATASHHAAEHKDEAKGGAASIGDPTTQGVKSEEAPSPTSAATQGSDQLTQPQGDTRPETLGGEQSGENGAVAAPGGQEGGGTEESPASGDGVGGQEETSGVSSPTATEGGDEGTEVGQTGASNVEKAGAANPTIEDREAADIADTLGGENRNDNQAPPRQQENGQQGPGDGTDDAAPTPPTQTNN
ncbi:hypothetical protein RDMS_07350 [Deinococcus sp. RL]|uniref:hypothetical protein n=1 Tax=Deinococcus sp. RL TaxID=1489678 RepID=UPI0004DA414E|nr:hypothetical protein [Deinococcus sp. RL]KEF34455.1 hypothetical protein RDMS_07350 [Deinococcus sp. RL]